MGNLMTKAFIRHKVEKIINLCYNILKCILVLASDDRDIPILEKRQLHYENNYYRWRCRWSNRRCTNP